MTAVAAEPIEQTIRTVAIRRLGAVDVEIVRHTDRRWDSTEQEPWYGLWLKLYGESESTLVGRRRTKRDLLELATTLDPRHLAGKRY
jgi:hypothetical protein